jgi:hypothetical protein
MEITMKDFKQQRKLNLVSRQGEEWPFVLVKEREDRVLKGVVIPTVVRGMRDGRLPTMRVHKTPQPKLILKAKPTDKMPGLESGSARTPKAQPKGGGISIDNDKGHPSQKVQGVVRNIAQHGSEYKNPDPGHSAGPKSSKPTPTASKQPSYQPPTNIQTSSVGTHTPVERQKPQASYQPPASVRTAGVGSSKKTAAPQQQASWQPPKGTKTLELSMNETQKSLKAINDIIAGLKK